MAPGSNTGETLLDRSQRILGISLDDGEENKQKSRASGNQSSDGSATNRRREQIGQAQRIHRQRTQRYIRELENEVLKLRELEKSAQNQNRVLQDQRDLLLRLLLSNNISPPDLGPDSPFVNSSLDSTSSSHGGQTEDSTLSSVNVDMSLLMETPAEYPCSIKAAERVAPNMDQSLLSPLPTDPIFTDSSTEPSANALTTVVDSYFTTARLDAQAGIDFILALEHPCLPHIKYSLEHDMNEIPSELDYNYGSGHVFTATASLFWQTKSSGGHAVHMPQNELDKLLDASRRLKLEYEMTPIQVWQRILDISKTQAIGQELLDAVKNDCSKFTFCNSFGTVIDKSFVEFIFNHHFPQSATTA